MLFKTILKRILPKSLRSRLKKPVLWAKNTALDTMDRWRGIKNNMVPPRNVIFIGDGDFLKTGEEFLEYFIDLGNLKPDSQVLDIGCGMGRMAIPLTKYLNDRGRYEGFDIVESGIHWCTEKIHSKDPRFRFKFADIFNKNYNPKGIMKASEYRFPYKDASFDFIFLTSVFTHMLPTDVEHYLREIHRVLKKGGTALATFFLLNDESTHLIHHLKSDLDFKHEREGALILDENNPEEAVAYEESFVSELLKKTHLNLRKPIRYGAWCGRKKFLSYQDILILEKE